MLPAEKSLHFWTPYFGCRICSSKFRVPTSVRMSTFQSKGDLRYDLEHYQCQFDKCWRWDFEVFQDIENKIKMSCNDWKWRASQPETCNFFYMALQIYRYVINMMLGCKVSYMFDVMFDIENRSHFPVGISRSFL